MRNVQVTLPDALAWEAVQAGLLGDPFVFRLAHALISASHLGHWNGSASPARPRPAQQGR